MPRFQVVSLKPLSGIAKQSQRPYEMLVAAGVFTGDDGVCEVGEITFMKREGHPLPALAVGQSYTPTIGASSRDGKLQFQITELKPVVAGSVKAAA